MLDALRRGVGNILAKILLGLLVIAFAVWGVSDVFRGYGQGTIARIGSTEISAEEFRNAYQDEMTSLSRRLGRRLTPEQAKLLGVEQRALQRLLAQAAVAGHANELNLALSENGIAQLIRTDPAFLGGDGTFSNSRFRDFLRQNGLTEARYVFERRRDEVRDQLTDTLLVGLGAPKSVIDLLHGYREETRTLEFFTPDYARFVKVPEPDDARLGEYYEQNKRQFLRPELRRINLLLLTRDIIKARAPVTEEELKAAYEETKETFNIPEKRRVQQLAFPDKAAADKAYAELAKTRNFKEAIAKLGFKEADIDLGLLTRRDMIDPKIAEATFGLKKDVLSRPVEGQFASVVLLRVTEIQPGKQRTYDEVKGELRDRIAGERAAQELQGLHDQVENQRSTGTALKDIGEKLKLPYAEIAETDREGKTGAGKTAIDHTEATRIALAAFGGLTGVEAEAVELEAGYAWFDVLGVTPEAQKPFDEVKAEVRTLFMDSERRKETIAFAGKLTERLNKGDNIQTVAKETGGKVDKTNPITRATTPPGLSSTAVQQAFALPKGGAASSPTTDGKLRTVFRVAEVTAAPPPTAEQSDRLKAELARQLQTDVLAEYINGLQTRYGVTINQAVLKRALGTRADADGE
jgi:peptidyl-prolyl cis-trans isomerase D